jgi:hypothetical protein
MTDDMMPSAANGGIVAFAGEDESLVTDPMGGISTTGIGGSTDDRTIMERVGIFDPNERNLTTLERLGITNPKNRIALENAEKPFASKLSQKEIEAKIRAGANNPSEKARVEAALAKKPPAFADSDAAERADRMTGTLTAGGKKKGLNEALAVGQAAQNVAQNAGVEEQPLEDRAMSIYKKFKEMSSAELKGLNDAIEGKKGDADKIKAKGLSEALMQFGFGMAANAAKPGAKFIGSASAAAPILGQVASENEKLQRAASDNYMKLKMDQTRYQVALDKGDMQAATSLASQIRQGNMQQKQLDAQIDHWNKQLQLERQKMGVTAAAYAPQSIREAEWLMANKDNPAAMSAYEKSTRQKDVAGIRANSTQQLALEKSLEKLKENYPMLKLDQSTPEWKKAWAAYTAEANRITERHRKMFNDPTLMNPDIGGGATLNPNVKVLN